MLGFVDTGCATICTAMWLKWEYSIFFFFFFFKCHFLLSFDIANVGEPAPGPASTSQI
jgi:hypothetical protein